MIKRAELSDIPRCVELGREFVAYSPYCGVRFDPDATAAFFETVINGAGAIFLHENGMIGGVLLPLYFAPTFKVAAELFWWAPDGDNGLKEAFEAWAQDNADAVQFSGLCDHREKAISRLYRIAGFERAEVAYIKRF